MVKINSIIQIATLPAALLLNACSGGGSSGISNLASLPRATGAVTTSGSTGLSKFGLAKNAATTGVTLSALADFTDWGPDGKSMAMCESGSMIRELIRDAARPDKIVCYIGAMEAANLFENSYDGNYHYYTLTGTGDGENPEPFKIKFKVTKTGEKITFFEMFTCNGDTQGEYVSTSISGSTATVTSIQKYSEGAETGGNSTSATGTINSSGQWLSKTITSSGTWASTGGQPFESHQELTLVQGANTLTLTAARKGTDGELGFGSRVYALMQLLNPGSISTFAIGDGSANGVFTFTNNEGTNTEGGVTSWTGDDRNTIEASLGDYYSQVASATLPNAASTVTISFSEAQTWDCKIPEGKNTDVNIGDGGSSLQAGMKTCNQQYDFDESGYVNCWGN